MRVLKIDHLGIAVKEIAEARRLFQDILGLELNRIETVEEQKVTTATFLIGDTSIELLESTSADSPVAKFIEKRDEGRTVYRDKVSTSVDIPLSVESKRALGFAAEARRSFC